MSGRREAMAVGLGLVGLACALTWPLPLYLPSHLTAQPFGDPILNTWILAWTAERLPHALTGWWQAPFFYPYPDTLAYSEHLLGIAIFTAPIQWLSGNPVLAYNLALLGSIVLAGLGAYLLAREVTGRRDAAVVAALVYAASPYRVPQVTHLQVLMNGWLPLALWGLHRYGRTGRRRDLAVGTLAFLMQCLSNGYLLFFGGVPMALVGLEMTRRAGPHWARRLRDLAVAGVAVAFSLAPFLLAYLRVRREQGLSRTFGDLVQFGASPSSYFSVSGNLRLWGPWLPVGIPERELFPGLIALVLAAAAISGAWWSRTFEESARREVWLYAAVALVTALLSLGPQPLLWDGLRLPTGPYGWLAAILPGLDGLRVPARIAIVFILGLAVLAAIGFAWLTERLSARRRAWLAAVIGVAIALEGAAIPLDLTRLPTPDMAVSRAAYEWLRDQPRGPMLELPVGDVQVGTRYLLRTLVHGNPIVNGYSGYGSALQDFVSGPPLAEIDHLDGGLAMLQAIRVRYLVVHEHLYSDRNHAAEIRAVLSASPRVRRRAEFGTTSVFELRADPAELHASTGPVIPPAAYTATAVRNGDHLKFAFDGDRSTRWTSGQPQSGDEWIALRFDRPRRLSLLRLQMGRESFADYPRRLLVEGEAADGSREVMFDGPGLPPLGLSLSRVPVDPSIDVPLRPSTPVWTLWLRQTGRTSRSLVWSVHDVEVRE